MYRMIGARSVPTYGAAVVRIPMCGLFGLGSPPLAPQRSNPAAVQSNVLGDLDSAIEELTKRVSPSVVLVSVTGFAPFDRASADGPGDWTPTHSGIRCTVRRQEC
jgi:hypothetical protein